MGAQSSMPFLGNVNPGRCLPSPPRSSRFVGAGPRLLSNSFRLQRAIASRTGKVLVGVVAEGAQSFKFCLSTR